MGVLVGAWAGATRLRYSALRRGNKIVGTNAPRWELGRHAVQRSRFGRKGKRTKSTPLAINDATPRIRVETRLNILRSHNARQ